MRNDGAAHKNMEAPRSINRAMHEDGISVTSHQLPVTSHHSKKHLPSQMLTCSFPVLQGTGW